MPGVDSDALRAVGDEKRRKVEKPKPTCQEADALVSELFCLDVDCKATRELDSYDDRNFVVLAVAREVPRQGQQTRYLLKIHNGVESDNKEFLMAQNATMLTLAKAGIDCPKPCGCHGKHEETFEGLIKYKTMKYGGGERPFAVRLLTWVVGTPLSNVTQDYGREVLVDLGRYLGRLRSHLDGVDYPGCHRPHMWDLAAFANMRSFTSAIERQDRRDLVLGVLEAYETSVLPLADGLPKATLMGDFNEANIIMDDRIRVSGVIDFGDIIYSHRVNELAIAMAYGMITKYGKAGKAIDAAVALYEGFVSVCRLEPSEKEVLRVLIACRLACSATMGAYSISQEPTNEYLKLHAEPSWAVLEHFWTDTTLDTLLDGVHGAKPPAQ